MATGEATPKPVGVVIGENVRRLREGTGLTQAELARFAQREGLRWTRSHIAALEAGNRESVELGTLLLLARAVSCTVPELFAGEGRVQLSGEATTTRESLRQMFAPRYVVTELVGRAGEWQAARERYHIVADEGGFTSVTPVQADADLAERLGVMPEDVYKTAQKLWDGLTLHEERDRRIAELGEMSAGERRARRGHITRELSRQIEAALTPKRSTKGKGPRRG